MRCAGAGLGLPLAVAFAASATPAAAQGLAVEGRRITTNDYAIDLFQGPVLASSRVIGMAGAYVAIGEYVDGDSQNPVAPAVRTAFSFAHIDYDLGVGVTFPSSLAESDFFNSGHTTDLPKTNSLEFVFLDAAVNLQVGPWGLGVTTGLQQYGLLRGDGAGAQQDELRAQIGTGHTLVARAFAHGQFFVGLGLRTTGLTVINRNAPSSEDGDNQALFTTTGAAPELGLLWRPNDAPLRVGFAAHAAVDSRAVPEQSQVSVLYPDTGDELFLPNRLILPWDVNAGVAVQLGPRPFNPRWEDPRELVARVRRFVSWRVAERERRRARLLPLAQKKADPGAAIAALDAELETEAALDELTLDRAERITRDRLKQRYEMMSRFKVLISTSLVVTGAADSAVGIESFLQRTVQRSGQSVSLSPRLGAEIEPIPHFLQLRGGSYLEPTRFRSNADGPRLHFTSGLDLKLLTWSIFDLFEQGTAWRIGGALDVSRDYLGWSVTAGVWH